MTVEPEIIKEYVDSGQVRLVFRPVLDFQPASQIATEAAYCAGEQKPAYFWEMHNLLFERQGRFGAGPDQAALAKEFALIFAGLDQAVFAACLDGDKFGDQIVAQDEARRAAGIRQRPSFRISGPGQPEGRLIAGAQSFSTFQKLIAAAAGP